MNSLLKIRQNTFKFLQNDFNSNIGNFKEMRPNFLKQRKHAYLCLPGVGKGTLQNGFSSGNINCRISQRNFTRYSNKGRDKKKKSLLFVNGNIIVNRLNKIQDKLKRIYNKRWIYQPNKYKNYLQGFRFQLSNKYTSLKRLCHCKLSKYKTLLDGVNVISNITKSEKLFRYFLSNMLICKKQVFNKISYSVQNINTSYYKKWLWHNFNRAPITHTLILLHLGVFFLWLKAKPVNYDMFGRYEMSKGLTIDFMYKYFCCSLQNLREKKLYTLCTCLISHNTIQSLLLNTLTLFYIGRNLEILINSKNFLTTYLISGLISTYLELIYHKNQYHNVYAFGASGSISSILMTYTFMYPKQNIYLYGLIALPLALFSGLYFLNELYCVLINKKDSTGHISHLSGMGLGVLYYYYIKQRRFL